MFINSGGNGAAADALGGFIQRCPGGLGPISRDEFYEICEVSRRFAPGPDGVSFRTWRLVVGKPMVFFTIAMWRF